MKELEIIHRRLKSLVVVELKLGDFFLFLQLSFLINSSYI